MRTVYKYSLAAGPNIVHLPIGAQVTRIALQGEDLRLWALVETDNRTEPWHIVVTGTGHSVAPGNYVPLGSFEIEGLIFHVLRAVP